MLPFLFFELCTALTSPTAYCETVTILQTSFESCEERKSHLLNDPTYDHGWELKDAPASDNLIIKNPPKCFYSVET